MADFVLWGRIQQIGAKEFAVLATAVCADSSVEAGVKAEIELATSRANAETRLRAALLALGALVRSSGHQVVDVETDGL